MIHQQSKRSKILESPTSQHQPKLHALLREIHENHYRFASNLNFPKCVAFNDPCQHDSFPSFHVRSFFVPLAVFADFSSISSRSQFWQKSVPFLVPRTWKTNPSCLGTLPYTFFTTNMLVYVYKYVSYGQNLVHGEGTSLSRVGPYRFCSGDTLYKPA